MRYTDKEPSKNLVIERDAGGVEGHARGTRNGHSSQTVTGRTLAQMRRECWRQGRNPSVKPEPVSSPAQRFSE